MVRSSKGHGSQTIGTAARVIATAIGVLATIVSLVGAYYGITARLDRFEDKLATQSKTLESLASSINTLAQEAINEERLRSFCLSAALANNGRWICPLSGVQQQVPQAQPVRRSVRAPSVTP